MATFSWLGTANDGLFSNPDNWGPPGAAAGPPGPADAVSILTADTIEADQPVIEIGGLSLASGTIDDSGNLLIIDGVLAIGEPFGAASLLTVEAGEVDFAEIGQSLMAAG